MNASGDAAEQVVRMTLEGVQVAAKITGAGAEHIAKILMLALKDTHRTKGKASLAALMKSNKPIKVFSIKDDELKKFCQEAKKYGVLYHVLKDKDKKDGKCDIMVKAEDASKVNRIFERFHLSADNRVTIRKALDKAIGDSQPPKIRSAPGKAVDDKFLDMLFGEPPQKEKSHTDNPTMAKTERSRPSAPISENKDGPRRNYRDYYDASKRPSVRAELKNIRAEQNKKKQTTDRTRTPVKTKSKSKGDRKHGSR